MVADLGNQIAQGLGQDDVKHGLHMRHADGFGALHLAGIHGLDAAPDRFRHIGAGIDGKDDDRRGKRIQRDAQAGQAVKDDEKLHQQRRAADDPYVEPCDLPQHRHIGVLHQRHRHRDDKRQRERDGSQRDGDGQAGQQYFTKGIHKDSPQAFGHGAELSFFGWGCGNISH